MTVSIIGTHYLVVDVDGGMHMINKNHECSKHGAGCKAVWVVARYLLDGGARAPDTLPSPPRIRPTPLPPCPICGAEVEPDYVLDRAQHGRGWRCTVGGYAHLFLYRYPNVRKWFCEEGAKRHEMFI